MPRLTQFFGGFLRMPWAGIPDVSETATGGPPPRQEEDARGTLSQWQLIRRNFAHHRLAVISVYVLALMYGVAIFADVFAVHPATHMQVDLGYCPPTPPKWSFSDGLHVPAVVTRLDPVTLKRQFIRRDEVNVPITLFARCEPYKLLGLVPLEHRFIGVDEAKWQQRLAQLSADGLDITAGNKTSRIEAAFYPLGADSYGRCIFSRIVYGARVSLSVGLLGIAFTFMLGTSIGGVSGYVGGRTDNFIQRGIEIINAVPQLPLWIALAAIFPQNWTPLQVYFSITVVLSMLNWTGLARVVRGKILSLREEDYAVAARLLGASHTRVLFRHLLPGFTSHILVALTLSIPGMILGETALSFLGLGIRPPVVSWGVMLQDCMDVKATRFYPWLLTPSLFIVVTVLTFNFVGDGLRDAADPYASK